MNKNNMNNEIKVGDKVRVSENISQIYKTLYSMKLFESEHIVVEIEDGMAILGSNPPMYKAMFPTKYLVKVEDEKQNDMTNEELKKAAKEWSENMSAAIKEYGNAVCETYKNAVVDAYWDGYTAALAKEVAVKIVNKNINNYPEEVGAYAVKLAKSVVENLRKK